MLPRIRGAVLGAVALLVGTSALAGTTLPPSSFALARFDGDRLGRAYALQSVDLAGLPDAAALALTGAPAPANVELSAVRYQPAQQQQQQQYDNPPNDRPIVSQLHGGYFDASSNNTNPFIVGLRAGPMVDKRLQVGIAVDWVHQTKNLANVLSQSQAPGDITVSTKQDT